MTFYKLKSAILASLTVLGVALAFLTTAQLEHAEAKPGCKTFVWKNLNSSARSVPYIYWRRCLHKFNKKPRYYIRVFGKCSPKNCDWGWRKAKRYGKSFYAFYNQGFVKRRLRFKFSRRNMKMRIHNTYKDSRGRKVWNVAFRRAR